MNTELTDKELEELEGRTFYLLLEDEYTKKGIVAPISLACGPVLYAQGEGVFATKYSDTLRPFDISPLITTIRTLTRERDEAREELRLVRVAFAEASHNDCQAGPEIDGLTKQLATITAERDALQAWKDSMMQVEREWDEQKVGKLLKLPFGSSIRAGIEPAIVELIDERDALKEENGGLREALLRLHGYNMAVMRGQISYRPEDHVEVAEMALSTPSNQSPWRPIETAPKDGEPILLYKGDERRSGPFTITGFWSAEGQWWPCAGAYEVKPTHWMPLPQPPTEGGEGHE